MALRDYALRDVAIGARSRSRVKWMRWLLPRFIRWLQLLPGHFYYRLQRHLARDVPVMSQGLPVDYDILDSVPVFHVGHAEESDKPVFLYLHGGGFVFPVVPKVHLRFVARISQLLGARGVVPDYRLAPMHKYPAPLDDCETVYRALLDSGVGAERIVIGGESAGGNLVLALLQRIRSTDLPLPAGAVAISAVAECTRFHSPPSRLDKRAVEAMLPVESFPQLFEDYAGGADGSDPELSPVFADYNGFPPIHFLVGEDEVLLDDTLICHRQAQRAGVKTRLDVWPVLPHAFPLLDKMFPEARVTHDDIASFLRACLEAAEGH